MKLKKLRLLRKMSTTELSRISGVHQTTISALENNKHASPGIDTVERLARALRVSPLYFFEDRVRTPFDLVNDLPSEISDFLLREESLPYLMLSKKAFENGISSMTIEQLLRVLQETYSTGKTRGDENAKERKRKDKGTI